jgi:hypothetical protein
MVMAALVLVLCLTAALGHCQEERRLLADLSLMSCLIQGQQYASDWLVDHPTWTLSGWRLRTERVASAPIMTVGNAPEKAEVPHYRWLRRLGETALPTRGIARAPA